jgi:hypothetical protein
MKINRLVTLGSLLFVVSQAAFGFQTEAPSARLVERCRTVSLKVNSSILSPVILAGQLREREEFESANLKLAEQPADVELIFVDPARPFGSSATNDVEIFGVRKDDGTTASAKVTGLGDFEGVVAGTAIDVLHKLCPAVMTTRRWRRSGREPLDEAASRQFREARSLSVISHTSWMNEDRLERAIAARAEVQVRHLTMLTGDHPADLRLEITHDIKNTLTWRYQVVGQNRESLLTGYVAALSEQHAIAKIADSVVRRLSNQPVPLANDDPEGKPDHDPRGTWQVLLITGDPRTTLTPLTINIDGRHFAARNILGQTVYSFDADDLEDAQSSSVRDRVLDLPTPDRLISFVKQEPTTDTQVLAEAEGFVVLLAYGGLAAALNPIKVRQHFIDVVWSQGDIFQQATFQVRGSDVKGFMGALLGLSRANCLAAVLGRGLRSRED